MRHFIWCTNVLQCEILHNAKGPQCGHFERKKKEKKLYINNFEKQLQEMKVLY